MKQNEQKFNENLIYVNEKNEKIPKLWYNEKNFYL